MALTLVVYRPGIEACVRSIDQDTTDEYCDCLPTALNVLSSQGGYMTQHICHTFALVATFIIGFDV